MKLVIQNMSRVWGGNEKWLSILATELGRRGHDVIVSCPAGPVRTRLHSMGIPTTGFRPRGMIDPVSALAFAMWLRRTRPDAVLMTSWHSVAWTTFAARAAAVKRVVLRNGIVREAPRRGARAVALRSGVDAIIVNASEIRDAWLRTAPDFPPGRVHVVLNAIDSRFGERESLRRTLREQLRSDPDALLIGSAGNLFPRKGFDLLIRAFSAARIANSCLVIIGDGAQRQELEALAGALGISGSVHFLGQRANGPDLIGGLDIFALASRNEGMANVMLEAMAAGTPVIASKISGVETALGEVDGSRAGWIVDELTEESFAASLQAVARDVRAHSAEVDARVREAHSRIVRDFSRDRMVNECEAILFGK